MDDVDKENFAIKLTDAAKHHDEWLAIVRFGLPTLLNDQPLLFEIMSREAGMIVERRGTTGFVTADALRQIFIELKLKLVLQES